PEGRPPIAPRDEIEVAMAEIWAGVLRVEPVGIRDDFFDLGGTSLLAVDLFAQVERRFGKRLPLTAILEAPPAERLGRLGGGGPRRRSGLAGADPAGRGPAAAVPGPRRRRRDDALPQPGPAAEAGSCRLRPPALVTGECPDRAHPDPPDGRPSRRSDP